MSSPGSACGRPGNPYVSRKRNLISTPTENVVSFVVCASRKPRSFYADRNYTCFIILSSDAHFSQDSPCHSVLDLSLACCPAAGEPGSASPNRHPSALREKTSEADPGDRLFWVGLPRLWRDCRSAQAIVRAETVVAWQRAGFRLFWTWKVRAANRDDRSFPVRSES